MILNQLFTILFIYSLFVHHASSDQPQNETSNFATVSSENNSSITPAVAPKPIRRETPNCKQVVLKRGEYKISDRLWSTRYSRYALNFSYVEDSNDTHPIIACFQLSKYYRTCSPKWPLDSYEFEIYEDGTVFNLVHNLTIGFEDYQTLSQGKIRVCADPEALELEEGPEVLIKRILLIGWIVSDASLLLCFVIYLLKPNKKFSTWGLLCQIGCLFFGYLIMIFMSMPLKMGGWCAFLGSCIMWFFLTSIFWLNSLAFDFYRQISRRDLDTWCCFATERRRFVVYCIYSWSIPTLLLAAANLVDKLAPGDSNWRPQFDNGCWINNWIPKLAFFYLPVAITLVCNIVLFALVVVALRRAGAQAALANRRVKSQLLRVYVKLLVVMGISWIFEVMSVCIPHSKKHYFYATDVINSFQGFFIFLVYTFKRDTLRLLNKRMPAVSHLLAKAISCYPKTLLGSSIKQTSLSSSRAGTSRKSTPPTNSTMDLAIASSKGPRREIIFFNKKSDKIITDPI